MNESIITGGISYNELRDIITTYFETQQNLKVGSISIDYLRDHLKDGNTAGGKFFNVKGELGEAKFELTKDQIASIMRWHLANSGYELKSIDFKENVVISFFKSENLDKTADVKIYPEYSGSIYYEYLREIIKDYYKEKEGVSLSFPSIDYLADQLRENSSPVRPYFSKITDSGNIPMPISSEDIKAILTEYFSKKGYELLDIEYGSKVEYVYKEKNSEKEETKVSDEKKINDTIIPTQEESDKSIVIGPIVEDKDEEKENIGSVTKEPYRGVGPAPDNLDEVNKEFLLEAKPLPRDFGDSSTYASRPNLATGPAAEDEVTKEVYHGVGPAPDNVDEVSKEAYRGVGPAPEDLVGSSKQKVDEPAIPEVREEPAAEIARMGREQRRFIILRRERALNDAQRRRNYSAIGACACILGAGAALYFRNQEMSQVIEHEIQGLSSWSSLVEYIKDLGPAVTLLTASAGAFVVRYFQESRRFRNIQHEIEDFNNSLENSGRAEGGQEDDRTR